MMTEFCDTLMLELEGLSMFTHQLFPSAFEVPS